MEILIIACCSSNVILRYQMEFDINCFYDMNTQAMKTNVRISPDCFLHQIIVSVIVFESYAS
ncbi:CLUMA_CG003882, isoform A [Clunio marinus]|uniref:CLUMA_CG003882, isoform A n=1 Tax=Clunio marinus TaxID=568069 RepID=A0A1J1HQ44_9DIPT|nr:CLUMA_CG003882, isoform A [Clunio marinus]